MTDRTREGRSILVAAAASSSLSRFGKVSPPRPTAPICKNCRRVQRALCPRAEMAQLLGMDYTFRFYIASASAHPSFRYAAAHNSKASSGVPVSLPVSNREGVYLLLL